MWGLDSGNKFPWYRTIIYPSIFLLIYLSVCLSVCPFVYNFSYAIILTCMSLFSLIQMSCCCPVALAAHLGEWSPLSPYLSVPGSCLTRRPFLYFVPSLSLSLSHPFPIFSYPIYYSKTPKHHLKNVLVLWKNTLKGGRMWNPSFGLNKGCHVSKMISSLMTVEVILNTWMNEKCLKPNVIGSFQHPKLHRATYVSS